jgi:hypothetical protein
MAEFAGVPDWPEQKLADGRDARLDNQPPLEERLVMEFVEELDAEGITARVAQLLASAAKAPEKIEDKATAGKVGDLLKMSADVRKRIETAREKHNRPLLNAQRALKAKADAADGELSHRIRQAAAAAQHVHGGGGAQGRRGAPRCGSGSQAAAGGGTRRR